jgi:hypothetical protein
LATGPQDLDFRLLEEELPVRFNHMELTFARGALDERTRSDIDSFYSGVLGWQSAPYELFGQLGQLLRPDDGQFILLMEVDDPIQSPSYDHLGLLLDSPDEVDDLLDECRRFQEKDDRLALLELDDLVNPRVTQHAFYVRYILPIWFDVHALIYPPGAGPERSWQYTAS